MKNGKRRSPDKPAVRDAEPLWAYAIGIFVCLLAAFEIYKPVLNAPFLYDDLYLPFTDASFAHRPLTGWINLTRPLLTVTYWINYQTSGLNPLAYHIWNILLHVGASLFAWLIVRNLLARVGETGWKREILAAFAGGVFLAHPLQTECVAYVASRSETLSVMFAYAALYLYLSRKSEAVGAGRAVAILVLFGAAAASKEHTVVLPGAFVLADLYWSSRPRLRAIASNWRLYAPIAVMGAGGMFVVARIVLHSRSAGFSMKDLTWYQYFFTQCRAIWVYIRMFFLPYGQNIDHDFPISASILGHGAILGLAGLIGLGAAAWYFRERFRLASFGIALFLFFLAPTSSIVPIRDVLVERRMYLPFIGILLVVIEIIRRVNLPRIQLSGLCGVVIVVLAATAYARNVVWSDPINLWRDTAEKSPAKSRPRFQLAYALYSAGQCGQAVQEYGKVAALTVPDTALLVDWAVAYDCNREYQAALEKLEQVPAKDRTAHFYSLMGMLQAKQGHTKEAWAALDEALKKDPRYDMAYFYRGNLRMVAGDLIAARAEYLKAFERNPESDLAKQALVRVETMIRAGAGRTP